jgi:hypothetical protein
MLAQPAKCERYVRKLERRAQEAAALAAKHAANVAYREEHPLRLGLVVQGDGLLLGMGDTNIAATLTASAGLSLQRELTPWGAVRVDLLGRLGAGRIDSWDIENGGEIHDHTHLFGGGELHTALLVRPNAFYVGPALSVGLLRFSPRTLHEQDYPGFSPESAINPDTVHIPKLGAYVAGGVAVGRESTPDGRVAVGLRFLIGAWNEFHHPYLQLALNATIKLWD